MGSNPLIYIISYDDLWVIETNLTSMFDLTISTWFAIEAYLKDRYPHITKWPYFEWQADPNGYKVIFEDFNDPDDNVLFRLQIQ